MASSTAEIVKGADVDSPTAIVTLAGTIASPMSLLESTTFKASVVSVLRLTVPVVVPFFSVMSVLPMLIVSDEMSSSTTSSIPLASACASAVAVKVTVRVPSTTELSTADTVNDEDEA